MNLALSTAHDFVALFFVQIGEHHDKYELAIFQWSRFEWFGRSVSYQVLTLIDSTLIAALAVSTFLR